MADTGFKSPTSTGEDHTDWTNPSDAFSSNDVYATATNDGEKQDYFDFTFGVSAGATIDGIEVEIEAKDAGGGVNACEAELSWNGGTTYTTSGKDTGLLTTSDVVYTLGGASDTWGRSWDDGEFSNANFRIRLNYDKNFTGGLSVDHVQIKVFFTEAAPAVASVINLGNTIINTTNN